MRSNDAFFEFSTEGIYKLGFDVPIDITIDEKRQIEIVSENAFLSDCNNFIVDLLGSHKSKLRDSKLKMIWDSNPIQSYEVISKFIKSGYQILNLETVEVNDDGKRKYYSNNLTGVIESGKLIEVWGNIRDITELKITVETLLKINECYIEKTNQVQQFNQELEKVFYKIVHDLNSPLSNIEGLINILKLNSIYESTEVKPLVDLMSTAVVKFKSKVKEVAKVPSVEHERLNLQSKVDFDKVWEKALVPYRKLIESNELKIESSFEVISADINSIILYSIFQGILNYAIKNSYQAKSSSILLKTYQDNNYIVFDANQTVEGDLDQLEEFHMEHEDSTMDLFLIEKIVESIGGKMELRRNPKRSVSLKFFLKK